MLVKETAGHIHKSWWRHQMETFSALLAICGGNLLLTGEFHKGQWRGALMFSFIYAWIIGWVNNGEAADLRCYTAHYDVIVMCTESLNSFEYLFELLISFSDKDGQKYWRPDVQTQLVSYDSNRSHNKQVKTENRSEIWKSRGDIFAA